MWKKIAPVGFSPGPTPTKDFDIDNFLAEIDHGVKAVVSQSGITRSGGGINNSNSNSNIGSSANNINNNVISVNNGGNYTNRDNNTKRNYTTNSIANSNNGRSNYIKSFVEDLRLGGDGEEEVKFNFESASGVELLIMELKGNINSVAAQMDEFKTRLSKAADQIREAETAKVELEEAKLEVEEENKLLQEIVAKGVDSSGSGMAKFAVGAGVGNRGVMGPVTGGFHEAGPRLGEGDIRKALLDEDDNEKFEADAEKSEKRLLDKLHDYLLELVPFRYHVRKIQARFGSSVSSYFTFYRFLFIQYSVMTVFCSAFLVYHSITIYNDNKIDKFYLADGLLPNFMMYSSFSVSENLYYSACLIFGLVFLMFTTLAKLLNEEKLSLEVEQLEKDNDIPYAKEVFCAWDFSNCRMHDAADASGKLTQDYLQLIESTKTKGVTLKRTRLQWLSLFLRRLLGFLLYAILQFSFFALIIYLTIYAAKISEYLKNVPVLKNFSTFIAPALVNLIGGVTPPLLKLITNIERWDLPSTQVNVTLFRIFLSAQLNILSVFFGYILLVNPFLLSDQDFYRYRVAFASPSPSSAYSCLMDQAADGLFSLVVSNIVINILTNYVSSIFPIFLEKVLNIPHKKEEFNIATKIVELLISVSYVLASFPFAPLSILFMPIYLFVDFRFNYYLTSTFYMKPKRPWKASKAGSVFTGFYLFSIIIVFIPITGYFLTTKTFAKDCDLQDKHVGLCLDDSVDSQCTMDSSSQYYQYFAGTLKANYPADVCDNRCGPYIHNVNAFAPIMQLIKSYFAFDLIWTILFSYPYAPWFLVSVLAIFLYRNAQAAAILNSTYNLREKRMDNVVSNLIQEKKRLQKLIERLKSIDKVENKADESVAEANPSTENIIS